MKTEEHSDSKIALNQDAIQDVTQNDSSMLEGITERIARSSGQAFYVWDIKSDAVEWSRGFKELIGFNRDEKRHLTGRSYEGLMGAKSQDTRFGKIITGEVIAEGKNSVSYQCIYNIQLDTTKETAAIWVEDTGCWYADETGRPMRAEGTIRIITDRRKSEEDLRRKTDFDDITGLPNRRALEKSIAGAIAKANQDSNVSAFMILSVDRVETINDVYGFETGDIVLKKIGELIRSKLRAGDIVCRFSGAKFGVILNKCSPTEIYDAGQRLLNAISSQVIETPNGHVSTSGVIGACFLPQHADNPRMAIHAAFQGMKNVKMESKCRIGVYFHDAVQRQKHEEQAKFSTQIVKALENNKIELSYQPVVGKNYKPAFYEALVRMRNEDGELISASEIIENVERLGLVRIVDRRVLQLVLKTLHDYPDAILSVNVSNDTVLDVQWQSELALGLASIENGASRLIVEITETIAAVDVKETKRFVENVKALGCRVAIDDFGAGFTSFANLKHLPIDIVKIDGLFGLDIANSKENQIFVKSLLSLTKAFGMETVVEWIEDEASATMLFEWETDYLQGYQFGAGIAVAPWTKRKVEENSSAEDKMPIAASVA